MNQRTDPEYLKLYGPNSHGVRHKFERIATGGYTTKQRDERIEVRPKKHTPLKPPRGSAKPAAGSRTNLHANAEALIAKLDTANHRPESYAKVRDTDAYRMARAEKKRAKKAAKFRGKVYTPASL